ncbi:hypothetical protein GCM10009768_19660 [Leucobacter iarius]|uniref:Uncharacterized protein n=1 Tax=Leucobacter iarius TaxID=333963 RepID=A0ABP4XT18_9MICO
MLPPLVTQLISIVEPAMVATWYISALCELLCFHSPDRSTGFGASVFVGVGLSLGLGFASLFCEVVAGVSVGADPATEREQCGDGSGDGEGLGRERHGGSKWKSRAG